MKPANRREPRDGAPYAFQEIRHTSCAVAGQRAKRTGLLLQAVLGSGCAQSPCAIIAWKNDDDPLQLYPR
jgi:hypothetical protein